MKKNLFFLSCGALLFVALCYADDCADAAHTIVQLREKQRLASCSAFMQAERETEEYKRKHSEQAQGRYADTWRIVILWSHAVPIIVWQLFALGLLVLCGILFYCGYRQAWLVFILLILALARMVLFEYESSSNWLVLPRSYDLYVGPGFDYPVLGVCNALDEVWCGTRQGIWRRVRTLRQVGWICYG